MTERFRKSWRGWIRSSEGYEVRVGSRTGIDYRDQTGSLHIDSETMSEPWRDVVVYTGSIPDRPGRTREEILARIERAFAFAGWRLRREDSWFDGPTGDLGGD